MRLLTLLFALFFAAPALAAQCPEQRNAPRVILNIQQGGVTVKDTHDIRALMNMSHKLSAASIAATQGHRHVPLGLTEVQPRFASSMQSEVTTLPNGTVCAVLLEMKVDLVFDNGTVYIANELPRSSCIYSEVLTHEYKHVEVNRQIINEWKHVLKQDLQDMANGIGVIRGRSQSDVSNLIKDRIQERLGKVFDRVIQARDAAQAQIDTPEEYKRVSLSCNGEATRYIPESLR